MLPAARPLVVGCVCKSRSSPRVTEDEVGVLVLLVGAPPPALEDAGLEAEKREEDVVRPPRRLPLPVVFGLAALLPD